MSRSRKLILVLVIAAAGYHWFGFITFAVAIFAFMLYELLIPPRRYRNFGPDQMKEAMDHKVGLFGKSYREYELDPDSPPKVSPKVGRNDPCPCGSGLKHKRCCGLDTREDES